MPTAKTHVCSGFQSSLVFAHALCGEQKLAATSAITAARSFNCTGCMAAGSESGWLAQKALANIARKYSSEIGCQTGLYRCFKGPNGPLANRQVDALWIVREALKA